MKRQMIGCLATLICLFGTACRFVVHKDDVIVSLRGDDWRKNDRDDVWSFDDEAASLSLGFHEVLERHPVQLRVRSINEDIEIVMRKNGDVGKDLGSCRIFDEEYRYFHDRVPVPFRSNDAIRIPARYSAEFYFFASSFFEDGEAEVGDTIEFDIKLSNGRTTKILPVRLRVDDTRGDSGFELIGH